ncbi:dynein regulatory complex protein 1 isoform X1 [Labrus bergylta]|uniref:dynein regulatory complex protein 1 isoform X1 n=1 Tax=Labrus bergylta TaxID=56723 RepID=UPI003313EF28
MEEVDKDQEEASEPENQQDTRGASEKLEEKSCRSQPQEEQVEESEEIVTPQRILNLQRDLPTLVTNIQTAADAKESMRRTEQEKARRLRLERLENDAKSCEEHFEEITKGWLLANQKRTPQELQEALNNQQKLCSALIEDKKKLNNELQQELRVGDDRFVKDLRKHAEERDLMMERMEEQIKTLTKEYREELAQLEEVYQQESEVLLMKDKREWEQVMKRLLDKKQERQVQRQKEVEEHQVKMHTVMLKSSDKLNTFQLEHSETFQVLERKCLHFDTTSELARLEQEKQKYDVLLHRFNLTQMKSKTVSLKTEIKNLKAQFSSQEEQFAARSRQLPEHYKRNIQQYEQAQKKIKHFAGASVRKFEQMWLMIEEEVKQLVDKVLIIDSLICEQSLGIAWVRPNLPFMEQTDPTQKQAQSSTHQAVGNIDTSQGGQRMMDASVGPTLETDTDIINVNAYKEAKAMQSESAEDEEEGKLTNETLKKVMELLCDEAGFLLEDKLLNLLDPLEKEKQTVVKLGSLLSALGIKVEEVHRLAHFLLKYKPQQAEQTEDVCKESHESISKDEEMGTSCRRHVTSELIDPNHVLPALKSFLAQHVRSRVQARQHLSFQHVAARDPSELEAYWESVGNIISEDKVDLWEAAERELNQYHVVLTEISELIPETQSLEQQNAELRMLLQQSLQSIVNTELEMPLP